MKDEDVHLGEPTLKVMNAEIEANKAMLEALGGPAALKKAQGIAKAKATRDAKKAAEKKAKEEADSLTDEEKQE